MLQSTAATPVADALEVRLRDRSATVAVIGLGYVGLPLAAAFVAAGFTTIGFDTDAAKIELLRRSWRAGSASARSSIDGQTASRLHPADPESTGCPTLAEPVAHDPEPRDRSALADEQPVAPHEPAAVPYRQSQWHSSSLKPPASSLPEPTADPQRLAAADAILICVPTPLLDGQTPDLGAVEAAARDVAATLRPGQLVVLESTTYPGTTRDVVLPILNGSGLVAGRDFFLAYSPERQDPGSLQFPVQKIPKVVGGHDPASLRLACALYEQAIERVVPVSSCEVAEASKILENTYRCVNIALINELKMLFDRMGVDIWEVIAAAATKPFGFQAFYPGPGLGGHCIAIDPFYLSWAARKLGFPVRSIELAGELNARMPHYVVDRVALALQVRQRPVRGSKIALLGVAYKKDVDDPRESPAFELLDLLVEREALVTYNDPHVPRIAGRGSPPGPDLLSSPLTAEYLAGQDCVLIVTDHSAYDFDFIVAHAPLIVDTRGATRGVQHGREKIVSA